MNLKKKLSFLTPIFLLLLSVNSIAEFNEKDWKLVCNDKEKKDCSIGILNSITAKDTKKKQTLATIFIQMGKQSKKQLDLVNKNDQTYKLGNVITNVPVLFADVPLNVDLRTKPLVKIGDLAVANLSFMNCNSDIGCRAMTLINKEVVEIFKKGKSFEVVFKGIGSNQNYQMSFPLKGFTKSFNELNKS